MAESGGEFSEEDIEQNVRSKLERTPLNRRQVLGGLGISLYGLANLRRIIPGGTKNERSDEAPPAPAISEATRPPVKATNAPTEVPAVTEIVAVSEVSRDGLTSEQEQLVAETAVHLTKVYGPKMNSDFYPTEEAKLEFFKALTKVGIDLNPDNPNLGNQLAAIIAWESGFSPVRISNNGSKGIGLIQFTGEVPGMLNTTSDELAAMSALKQLDMVKEYFKHEQSKYGGDFNSLDSLYRLVINPTKVDAAPADELFPSGSPEADRNRVLDLNHDRVITVGEAIEAVRQNAVNNYGENPEFL